jgi:putative ABC transport system permease protein
MENLLQDLRFGVRMLAKKPGFAALAVLALALGIGANSAIFTVVNTVLLRPLPFDDPDQLVWVWDTQPALETAPTSLPDFLDWREQNQSFEYMSAFQAGRMFFDRGDVPEDVDVGLVTPDMFPLLKVSPALGRAFTEDETQPGRFRVAVLSDRLWRRRFNSDPNVVGQTIQLSGFPYTIIGVMPAGFTYPNETELWRPLPINKSEADRGPHYLRVIARLKPGVSIHQAQAEMSALAGRIAEQFPEKISGHGVKLESLQEVIVGNMRPALFVLLGSVGFVLLIACANVANLLLARSVSRQKEIAVRTALGASRRRIVKQLVTESLLLAMAGGLLGLLLGAWGVSVLTSLSPGDIPRVKEIKLDGWVVAFTLSISILTGVVFGLAPAWQVSKPDLNESLKEGGRTGAGAGRNRLRSLLVVSEVALALVLLVGAGLMIKSFARLHSVNPGFEPENALTMGVALLRARYSEQAQVESFYRQLFERLGAVPGVQSVGGITELPLGGSNTNDYFSIEGRPPLPQGEASIVEYRVISPNYFKAMGIPLLAGRDVSETDTKQTPNVVVINESFARRHWPDENPIGHRIKLQGQYRDPLLIVGVVGDVRHFGLDEKPMPEAYAPYLQDPLSDSLPHFMTLVIRADSGQATLAARLREEIHALDKGTPVIAIKSMNDYLYESLSRRRFNMVLLGIFAGLALLLAAVGIYGVMSYTVTQRTHEIGVRMAIGARARDILRLVIGQAMTLALAGLAIGLVASFALTRLMESLLYGVSATDPLTFILISLVLTGVALGACFIPARRATKVDPGVALRYE